MRQQILGSEHFLIKQYANSNIINKVEGAFISRLMLVSTNFHYF